MVFNFDTPLRAFSVYIVDSLEAPGGSLTYSNNAGDSGTIATGLQANGNVQFFGILNSSAGFTTLTINDTTTDSGLSIDEIRFAPVPEPSTSLLLAGVGVCVSAAALRRRRTA